MNHSIKLLKTLQYPTGLFKAAKAEETGYTKAWIRDNIYALLCFEKIQDYATVKKTLHALLDILLQHEYKIDWMIRQPEPKERYRYIHARYDPFTGKEINEQWGNKQNDAIGALLFKIGTSENKEIKILRNKDDKRILQKIVNYLAAIEYWQDKDNGMWEENEEVHASSIGACVAGLHAIKNIVHVPLLLIKNGKEALNKLLPNESITKKVDLALLSLIYPYNVVNEKQKEEILKNIEEQLVKEKGVIRYIGDQYYQQDGKEPEWTMGLPWLAIIHKQLGNTKKHTYYLDKTRNVMNAQGELPELYYGGTNKHNSNTPLAWSQSLYIVAAA
jgi:GH15 family glucan-1,4-alpha-glucosidase